MDAETLLTQGERFTVSVRGLHIEGRSWGDPRMPPLLALHGWMDNANSFAMLGPLLTAHHVIAIDFPGHGLSQHRGSDEAYFFTQYVLDVVHIIRSICPSGCDVLGHSMGAGVASLVAAGSTLVRRLVLLDGVGPFASADDKAHRILKTAIDESLQGPAEMPFYATLDMLAARRKRATPYLSNLAVQLIVTRNAHYVEPQGWQWCTDPLLRHSSPLRYTESAVHNILQELRCPVLHVAAQHGLFAKSETLEARLRLIHALQEVSIDGHHHFHMSDRVDQVAVEINRFLRG